MDLIVLLGGDTAIDPIAGRTDLGIVRTLDNLILATWRLVSLPGPALIRHVAKQCNLHAPLNFSFAADTVLSRCAALTFPSAQSRTAFSFEFTTFARSISGLARPFGVSLATKQFSDGMIVPYESK
jgi:hypothetical protein